MSGTEEKYGERNSRGHYAPNQAWAYPPLFQRHMDIGALLRWLPHYFAPWNLFYGGLAVLCWSYLTPDLSSMTRLQGDWIAWLLIRNAVIVVLFVGGWHIWLYQMRRQHTHFKYNPRWPTDDPKFFLGSQTRENIFFTLVSAVPIWTAWEVVTLWLWANGWLWGSVLVEQPAWNLLILVLVPLWRDLHFYCVHRLIHWPPLYKHVHALHHKNVNPGPWSGLSMHPVEHFLYFSCVTIHWIVPSHPIVMLFNLTHAALSPAQGHCGFHKIEIGTKYLHETGAYAHYLHHKLFDCNYADGVVPLDKWFGSFHDGSREAHQDFLARRKRRTR